MSVASQPISDKRKEQKDGKPTEGPYFFEPIPADAYTDPDLHIAKDSLFWIVDSRAAGEVLATVEQTAGGEAHANARLFAASWSLLDALKLAERLMADMDLDHENADDASRQTFEAVRDAVRLAEGR